MGKRKWICKMRIHDITEAYSDIVKPL